MDNTKFDVGLFNHNIQAQINLNVALNIQKNFWREKVGLKNFEEGDKNMTYFYIISKIKSINKKIDFKV